jgi:D-alanine-D-alanine ligase
MINYTRFMPKKAKLRIAILCGGMSSEHEVSLRSGAQVLKHLDRKRFSPFLITISKKGTWTRNGREIDPFTLKKSADVAFLALHGTFGEDGRMQSFLEMVGIPYTGSGVLASALAMDKFKTWQFLKSFGIAMPSSRLLTRADFKNAGVRNAFIKKTSYPCVVKPNASGSSVGLSLVKSKKEMGTALRKALKEDVSVIVQKYVKGREITCGVLGNSTAQTLPTVLPPVEIISHTEIFDYHAKYASKKTEEICPARLTAHEKTVVQGLVRTIHLLMGCQGLTRSDFILSNGTFYFLEINTLPGLTEQSICPREARAMGWTMTEFFAKQVDLALAKR